MSLIQKIVVLIAAVAIAFVAGLGFGYKWATGNHQEAKVINRTVVQTVEKVVPVLDNAALDQAKADAQAAKAEASGLKSLLNAEKANHATTKLLASQAPGATGAPMCPADPVISDGLRSALNASLGATAR